MCGIFGVWQLNDGKPISNVSLQCASRTLRHRGPDDEGHLLLNTSTGLSVECCGEDTLSSLNLLPVNQVDTKKYDLAFSFRRLSIIDLSSAGHQPMTLPDKSLWIVFNGEIYNYLELRAELERLGHRFRTHTDTEVILHAYQEWQTDCLARFNGMWAFALWDQPRRRLFCARDRFGIKPFYYFYDHHRFIFASEIKALFCEPTVPRRLNRARIYDYLTLGRQNHTTETFFEHVLQLPSAGYALVNADGALSIKSYWELQPVHEQRSDEVWVSQFKEILIDAVRLRLRSDVPVGSCLSGGIDSSSIVCIVSQLLTSGAREGYTQIGGRQKTFSSVYEYPGINEQPFIDAVVAQTEVEAYQITPRVEDLWDIAPRLIWHQDEPFGSTTIYSQWHVMQLARSHGITVLLDGQGADEIVAGYAHYYPAFWAELLRTGSLLSLWREWRTFPYHLNLRPQQTFLRALQRLVLHMTRRDRLHSTIPLPPWLNPGLKPEHIETRVESYYRSTLNQYLYLSLVQRSLPSLLHYEDRNSMAFSLEARVPYLDYRLVELSFQLPTHLKIHRGVTKVVLREAMRGLIPDMVRNRKDKLGFPTPGEEWFRGHLANEAERLFRSRRFEERGYINPQEALELLDRHRTGRVNAYKTLWRMMCLELWARVFLDRNDPTMPP